MIDGHRARAKKVNGLGHWYYYCNTGTTNFDANGLVASCSQGGQIYSVSNPADCAQVVDGVIANGSPLICPITMDFDSFSSASGGPLGVSYSRVLGGIHTPFAVQDGYLVGEAIGLAVAANSGLPEIVPEPPALLLLMIATAALYMLRLQAPSQFYRAARARARLRPKMLKCT